MLKNLERLEKYLFYSIGIKYSYIAKLFFLSQFQCWFSFFFWLLFYFGLNDGTKIELIAQAKNTNADSATAQMGITSQELKNQTVKAMKFASREMLPGVNVG